MVPNTKYTKNSRGRLCKKTIKNCALDTKKIQKYLRVFKTYSVYVVIISERSKTS